MAYLHLALTRYSVVMVKVIHVSTKYFGNGYIYKEITITIE